MIFGADEANKRREAEEKAEAEALAILEKAEKKRVAAEEQKERERLAAEAKKSESLAGDLEGLRK